ncbi:ABC transporter permease [Streptomyces sp. NBC_01102]|uniref:ABC transporter permease n=1 Tax=unclassified Streptomyces TaxID=2593676 RepID=UPI00386FACDA|nr:ABC transporter permease [Streptomyces sp. NBC_01102]
MSSIRLFFVGGLISFRALFSWLSPWIYIPSLLIAPIFQILLFVNLGRAANVGSDSFYLVGNAIQYIAIPCLFGIANTIAGERFTGTLGIILASPARRIPLFLGRALPTLANGWVVALFGLSVGSLLLGVPVPGSAWPKIMLIALVAAASCTGLGLLNAAVALRVRETSVLSNITFGILLIFCGVNVPLDVLPDWMAHISSVLPLTHAIEAARAVVAGSDLGTVGSLLAKEALIGTVFCVLGLVALRFLEDQSRRTASLDRM